MFPKLFRPFFIVVKNFRIRYHRGKTIAKKGRIYMDNTWTRERELRLEEQMTGREFLTAMGW